MLDVSKPFSTADCHQKRGVVCQNHLMDQNQNLIRLRGSRTRRVPCDIKDVDIEVEVVEGAIQSNY